MDLFLSDYIDQLNLQGAIDTATIDPRIKVAKPDDPEPSITLYVEDQSNPAMRLVSEMMILCGEVIATFGSCNNISLPYRGQPQSNISASAFSHLPEGPARSAAYLKIMRAAEMNFRKPIRHGVLGLPGYVQFTSPIRRYIDLLAHYQVCSLYQMYLVSKLVIWKHPLMVLFNFPHYCYLIPVDETGHWVLQVL